MGYRGSWRDRLNLNKEAWVKIAIAVVVAVIVSAIILHIQAPSKAEVNNLEGRVSAMGTHVAGTDADVDSNADAIDAIEDQVGNLTEEQFNGVANKVSLHDSSVNSLKGRMATAEGNITAIRAELATVGSPPEGYLTGSFGNYTLHAEASDAGNFTANINLVYSPPKIVGNGTTYDQAVSDFYSGIDYAAANGTKYACEVIYTGSAWGVSRVYWNIGTFELAANAEKAINIPFAGLNSTYKPSFAYAELYLALK